VSKVSKHPKGESKRAEKDLPKIVRLEQRVDVHSRRNGDWKKKTRDDVPPLPANHPMPENPFLILKPHKPNDQGNNDSKPEPKK